MAENLGNVGLCIKVHQAFLNNFNCLKVATPSKGKLIAEILQQLDCRSVPLRGVRCRQGFKDRRPTILEETGNNQHVAGCIALPSYCDGIIGKGEIINYRCFPKRSPQPPQSRRSCTDGTLINFIVRQNMYDEKQNDPLRPEHLWEKMLEAQRKGLRGLHKSSKILSHLLV